MIVSLEAIFLSTFVLISQNRADASRRVIADQQWRTVKMEDKQNEELLKLSKQILKLTQAIHEDTNSQSHTASPIRNSALTISNAEAHRSQSSWPRDGKSPRRA